MPNPTKPRSLKVIAGTERRDRAAAPALELPLVAGAPKPPDWLPNAHAVKEWHRLVPILMGCKLLTNASTSVLAMLCSLHGAIVESYAAGESPTASMIAQYRNLANDFGLSPVAQTKVKTAGATESTNPFARHVPRHVTA